MTRRLPDSGGIKVLPPHLTSGKDFARNRLCSQEVTILLFSRQRKRASATFLVHPAGGQARGDSFRAAGILQGRLTLAGEQGKWLGHGAYPLKSGLIGEICRNTQSQREDTLC